ncbi:equilibrative nucleotide transporter 1-like [Dioscorea cayenensis subsp. rotundata]|uniref:Equilibrative nucleotide transporter 1-like n=1 Tax=Dioscorea cayennensis subsp. rotundata TaxID=55577 RepID=A0AB40AXW8_DIOCR|nr:equilibrative nucleotide transporter 1-like [Dioscorea cayenensis subsp. rotundata]
MGYSVSPGRRDQEATGAAAAAESLLAPGSTALPPGTAARHPPPPEEGSFTAYVIYFILGTGYLLPWNAFITAVDYFSFLYPSASVDRVFPVAYMVTNLVFLLLVLGVAGKSSSPMRINAGLGLFVVSLVVVPVMDEAWVKGVQGMYAAYDVTVAVVVLAGIADAMVQSGVIGEAGELPERYMQATVAGTAASGVLVSAMRIITKSMYPQDADGLRKSANLYFIVSIVVMIICVICYNIVDKLPVVQYYKNLKIQALKEERSEQGLEITSTWSLSLRHIIQRIKWLAFANALIYVVTLSIFPGYITEDVHSKALKDWYPIILIAAYNVFDLVGKCFTAVYMLENAKIAVVSCVLRLLFYPLFLGCLHGPKFFRTEIPVTVLTCILGLTNGYLTSVLMIIAPKLVAIQHSETAGILMVIFLAIGLAAGSVVSWFWVI